MKLSPLRIINSFDCILTPKLYKELYGDGDSKGYNGKLVQGSQEEIPKATQQVSC